MNPKLTQIWHSPSVRNVGKLLSANVIAQAIGLLVYPILTRLYSPEDFGLLNLFLSIGSILVLLATSEYQSAILLPSSENEAAGVARVAMRIMGGWLLFISILTIFSRPISRIFEAPSLVHYFWLLLPYVGVMGAWSIYNAWLTRTRDFSQISIYQISQSTIGVLTKLLFGWLNWLKSGLIVSSVLAPLLSLSIAFARSREAFRNLWQPCNNSARELAYKYRQFPLYSLPRSLVNNLSGNLPALVLTPYFGLNELGFFAMAVTLSFRPITMITSSIHQVLFERVANMVREKQSIWKWLSTKWIMMFIIVIPIMIVLTVIMPQLVQLLLGAGWEQTATLIRYMMPWITCVFLIAPLAFISEVFGKQKLFLLIEIIYLALRICAMIAGIWMKSFELAIILMSVAGTMVLFLQLVLYIFTLRRYESTRLTHTSKQG